MACEEKTRLVAEYGATTKKFAGCYGASAQNGHIFETGVRTA